MARLIEVKLEVVVSDNTTDDAVECAIKRGLEDFVCDETQVVDYTTTDLS